jgi:hypothetical protein
MLFWNDLPGLKCKFPMTYPSALLQRDTTYLVNLDFTSHPTSLRILFFHLIKPSLIPTLLNTLWIVE